MYTPLLPKRVILNPADEYSRIFLFRGSDDLILSDEKREKYKYFEADSETARLPEDKSDCQIVGWSLAPVKGAYSRFGAVSSQYTSSDVSLTGLFDTVAAFGCDESYVYFHNLDFDGRFILNWLIKEKGYSQTFGKKMTADDREVAKNLVSILYNSGLYEIRFIYRQKCIVLRDSFKLWAEGIPAISDELVKINENDIKSGRSASFPLVRRKDDLPYDYDKVHEFGEKVEYADTLYMLNDVFVGAAVLQMFSKFGTLGVSCSGMAYQIAVRSFQYGVLSAKVVKYLIRERFDEISRNNEFWRFLKTVQHGDETYIFAKNYYTIDYEALTEKSKEYICKIKTCYVQHRRNEKIAISDIGILIEMDSLHLPKKLMQSVADIKEFEVIQELKKNIVYQSFAEDYKLTPLPDKILKYVNLMRKKAKTASHALKSIKTFDYYYQSIFKPLKFNEDEEIRPAYRGGLSAAVEIYSNVVQHNVISIDINSCYPYQMQDKYLPYGEVTKLEVNEILTAEKYSEISSKYKCFIIKFQADYCLQYPYNPMMAQKSLYGYAKFENCDYQYNQMQDDKYIYMTNVEFELFCDTHNVNFENVYVYQVWAYKACKNLFSAFVDKMYQVKANYKGSAMYEPVKQMLNSIYGRYAMDRFKFACYDNVIEFENELMRFRKHEKKDVDWSVARGGYLPVALFITAYARVQLIETANTINLVGGKVYYYDTDSLHISADNASLQDGHLCINGVAICEIDRTKLGAWKLETFKKIDDAGKILGVSDALFVCSKRYAESDTETGVVTIRCAGVPRKEKQQMQLTDIAIEKSVVVHRKRATKSGVVIDKRTKRFGFQKNIYHTENGIVISDDYYFVGDTIRDMYNRKAKVDKIIFKKTEADIEFFDSDEALSEVAGGIEYV